MILITGGVASGKRTYARQMLGYSDAQMADAVIDERPVVYNLQRLVARAPENAQALFDALRQKEAVIVCEVGSGIVPMERSEREAREQTGRLVNRLAAEAEHVVRMVCGLPQVLK